MVSSWTMELDLLTPWTVPPECQGQMVEVAYASTECGVVRRITDRSVPAGHPERESYTFCEWEDLEGEFEPWNEAPAVPPGAWQAITF